MLVVFTTNQLGVCVFAVWTWPRYLFPAKAAQPAVHPSPGACDLIIFTSACALMIRGVNVLHKTSSKLSPLSLQQVSTWTVELCCAVLLKSNSVINRSQQTLSAWRLAFAVSISTSTGPGRQIRSLDNASVLISCCCMKERGYFLWGMYGELGTALQTNESLVNSKSDHTPTSN